MTVVRFRITTADGRQYIGPVQGCGGLVDGRHALRRMWVQIEHANEDEPLGVYEPEPGHCCLYPEYSAFGNGPALHVSLKGATVEQLGARDSQRIGRAANAVAKFTTY